MEERYNNQVLAGKAVVDLGADQHAKLMKSAVNIYRKH